MQSGKMGTLVKFNGSLFCAFKYDVTCVLLDCLISLWSLLLISQVDFYEVTIFMHQPPLPGGTYR